MPININKPNIVSHILLLSELVSVVEEVVGGVVFDGGTDDEVLLLSKYLPQLRQYLAIPSFSVPQKTHFLSSNTIMVKCIDYL